MATRQSTIDFVSDQLCDLRGVRFRKMFGEYALYYEEKVVALICDDQVFVKITPHGTALVGERYEEGFPYPGAKPAMVVGADELENSERLCELIRVTAAALPLPVPRRPKQKKPRNNEVARQTTTAAKRSRKVPAATTTTAAKPSGKIPTARTPAETLPKAQRTPKATAQRTAKSSAARTPAKTLSKAQRAAKTTAKAVPKTQPTTKAVASTAAKRRSSRLT